MIWVRLVATVTMPVSSRGYVFHPKKFTPACLTFAEAASRRHSGVLARNRPTLNETGFVTVTLT
jgi:hypothetical protein